MWKIEYLGQTNFHEEGLINLISPNNPNKRESERERERVGKWVSMDKCVMAYSARLRGNHRFRTHGLAAFKHSQSLRMRENKSFTHIIIWIRDKGERGSLKELNTTWHWVN